MTSTIEPARLFGGKEHAYTLYRCFKCTVPARPSSRPPERRVSSGWRAPRLLRPRPRPRLRLARRLPPAFPWPKVPSSLETTGTRTRDAPGATPTVEKPRPRRLIPRPHPVAYLPGPRHRLPQAAETRICGLWDPTLASSSRPRRSQSPPSNTPLLGLDTPPTPTHRLRPSSVSAPSPKPTPGGLSAPPTLERQSVRWFPAATLAQAWRSQNCFRICSRTNHTRRTGTSRESLVVSGANSTSFKKTIKQLSEQTFLGNIS